MIPSKNYQLVSSSIEQIGHQAQMVFFDLPKIKIPINFSQTDKLILVGMGGSGLAGHLLKSLLEKEIKLPIFLINEQVIPAFVNHTSLVVLCSYSGNTKEVLAAYLVAKKRKAKIFIISSGGRLNKLRRQAELPGYNLDPRLNPSGLPNLAVAQMFFAQLALLQKLKATTLTLKQAVKELIRIQKRTRRLKNQAAVAAKAIRGKQVIVMSAEFLAGNAHALANQLNEIAKNFSTFFVLPELNHHLLEGLTFPQGNPAKLVGIFLASDLYSRHNQRRLALTREVFKRQAIKTLVFLPQQQTRLGQLLETLIFSWYLSLELAKNNQTNPLALPWVKYFKQKLAA